MSFGMMQAMGLCWILSELNKQEKNAKMQLVARKRPKMWASCTKLRSPLARTVLVPELTCSVPCDCTFCLPI